MKEIWRDIIIDGEDYSGLYQVSNLGRVKSLDRIVTRSDGIKCRYEGKILTPNKDKDSYLLVRIRNENKQTLKRVNRLVATAFLPNPDNLPQVAHIDGNRQNNIVTNLRWSTIKDNVNDPLTLKRMSDAMSGKNNPRAKPVICDNIVFDCILDCARCYEVPMPTMSWWLNHPDIMPERFKKLGLSFI